MNKTAMIGELLRHWRLDSGRSNPPCGRWIGIMLICLSLLVRWPKEPPRIEPFIYAHF